MLKNTQIGFEDIDEEYQAFVDKFKPKKTTDDCYTPENIYEAIRDWVVSEYGIDKDKILRPFYPGGDYEREEYPEGCAVVDNPPFSILTQICDRYMAAGVPFFLFAPSLTLFSVSSGRKDICRLTCGAPITYENGAEVLTSFVTNMDTCLIRTAPDLRAVIKVENDANLKQAKKELPIYSYPYEVMTPAMGQNYARHGIDFRIQPKDAIFIRAMDEQRKHGKAIFGGGYLLAPRAAAERAAAERAAAERAAAHRWALSENERAAVMQLEANNDD